MIVFQKGERKDDIANQRRAAFTSDEGVVFVGKAQDKCTVYRTEKRRNPRIQLSYAFVKSTALVNHHYFYCVDRSFGPFSLKFCSYFPYNAKLCLLIVGQAVTDQSNDKRQLLPMIHTVQVQSGQKPSAVLADSGYCSEENLRGVARLGVEGYIAVGKHKHNRPLPPAPCGRIPKSATLRDRMRRRLQTLAGRRIYADRKIIVEPVYGQIKQARGFRQFLLRGVEKVRGEWALICTGHNLLKLHRACTG